MSTTFVISLLALFALIIVLWRFAANAAAIVAVAGVLALAAWVTVGQVKQYHTQEQIDAENAASAPVNDATAPSTPALPPVVVAPPPLMNGPTGGAAPAVAHSPYSRS